VDIRALACICVLAGVFPCESSSLVVQVKEPTEVTSEPNEVTSEPNEVISSNVGMLPNIYARIHIHVFA